jgi:hypothetical protein
VERADRALEVVVGIATQGGDLEQAVRELLHVCGRNREAVEGARANCALIIEQDPHDLTAQRAIELLDGALRTPLFAPAMH